MEIKIIASGSSGNCYHISDGNDSLLIECGIQLQAIRKALDFKLSGISGCLISHSHLDHCRVTDKLLKAGLDCYMSESTRQSTGVMSHRVHVFQSLQIFNIGSWKVLPFPLEHDAENHGFLIVSKTGEKLCYITDSYYCKYQFKGVHYYMIECNYDKDLLEENIQSGIVPAEIRNRITRSHFELQNVKDFFRANDLSVAKEIHLIHRSSSNCPTDVQEQIQALTGKEVYTQ